MKERARYIKTVVFNSINDISVIEPEVNATIDGIKNAGSKIVSIVPAVYGLSPMHLIYNIIYESDHALADEELKGTWNEGKQQKSESSL